MSTQSSDQQVLKQLLDRIGYQEDPGMSEYDSEGHLIELHLQEGDITSLPSEIGNLTNLQRLFLNDNRLTELPAEIGQLTRLSSLWVNHNQLTHLPAEIGRLSNLHSLSLGSNRLRQLPAEIGQLTSLLDLYLPDNHLPHLPAEIGQLGKLEYLYLSKNPLEELPDSMQSLINLRNMYPNANNTCLDEEQREQFASEIKPIIDAIARGKMGGMGGPQPLRVLEDDVFVMYGHFNLADAPGGENFTPDFRDQERWMQTGPGVITILSVSDHSAQVRMEAWENEPPPAPGQWDEMREAIFTPTGGSVTLWQITGGPSPWSFFVGTPGVKQHVRAYRRRHVEFWDAMSRYREDQELLDPDGNLFPSDQEHYLLQFWPV